MLELTPRDILLGKHAANKEEAIVNIANDLIKRELVVEGYERGMLEREQQHSTFLGNGIAIPHGTTDTRDLVKQTGVQIHHFAQGVDWGDGQLVYLAIGIAAKSDEHLSILKQLTRVLSNDGVESALKKAKTEQDILDVLQGKNNEEANSPDFYFDESTIVLNFPAIDLLSLVVTGASKLRLAQKATKTTVCALIEKEPTYLGQGLWMISTDKDVKGSALSFISVQTPFLQDDKEVKGVLVLAAANSNYGPILSNLSQLIFKKKISDLFALTSAQDMIQMLTQIHQSGMTQIFKIKNAHGLHARPGAMLVNAIKPFEAKVWVSNVSTSSKQVNAKSLMKVIGLGVKQGHELEFVAQGVDAAQALQAVGQAIENGLGEG